MLYRIGPQGGTACRCAECSARMVGEVRRLCWCGTKLSDGRDAGFRCRVNENQTPENPDEIIVVHIQNDPVRKSGPVMRYKEKK